MSDPIDDARANNLAVFLEHGPGLRTDYTTWVEARDRTQQRVLIGGLGGMGCGQMWFDEEPDHANCPGYAEAPEATAPPPGEPW